MNCPEPGCTGKIEDGYCTECGHSPGDLDNMLDALELPWPAEGPDAG